MRGLEGSEVEFTVILVNGEPVKHFRYTSSGEWKPLYKEPENNGKDNRCEHTDDLFGDIERGK